MKTIQKILASLALAATVLVGSISPASAADQPEPSPGELYVPPADKVPAYEPAPEGEMPSIELPPIVVDPASKGGAIVVTGEKK